MLYTISYLVTRYSIYVQIVIREGDEAQSMYFVMRGRLEVSTQYEEQTTFVMHMLENGSCFGQRSLFSDSSRMATVRALTFCELESLSIEEVGTRII